MRYVAPAGFSIKKDCTGGGRMASGDDVVQGRFSGTVTSDNSYEITFIDCKIDVFKGAVFVRCVLVERHTDVVKRNHFVPPSSEFCALFLFRTLFHFLNRSTQSVLVMMRHRMIRSPVASLRSLGVMWIL